MTRMKLPQPRKPHNHMRELYSQHVKVERSSQKIYAKQTNTLTISGIIDDYFGVSAAEVAEALQEMDESQPLRVVINSYGGLVYEAIAIHNLIAEWPAAVNTHISSIAASAATLLFLVGDERTIADNGEFMVHNPWTFAMGNSKELRASADHLDKTSEKLLDLYERKSKKSRDELVTLLDGPEGEDGSFLNAQETLDAGFATGIIDTSRTADGEKNTVHNSAFPRRTLAKVKLLT